MVLPVYPLSLLKLSQFPPQSCPLPLNPLYLPLLSHLLFQIGFYSNSSDSSFLFVSFIYTLLPVCPSFLHLAKARSGGYPFFFPFDLVNWLFALVNSVPTPCVGMLTPILKRRLPLLSGACTTYATPPSSPSMRYFLG